MIPTPASRTGNDRPCPVCAAVPAQPWLSKGSLLLVRCEACSMVYARPVDSPLVSGQFYDRLAQPYYLSPDKLDSDYAPVRFERELRLFRQFCRSGPVLDVGCSTGAFLYQLQQRWPGAYSGVGTDVAGAALDYAESKGVAVRRGAFLELDFAAASMQSVTFWAVLEHLVEPGRYLQNAARLLMPEGYCFVLVPNFNSLAVRLLGARYRYLTPEHVNYFTSETLQSLAATVPSLEIVTLRSTHFNPVVLWQDFRQGRPHVPEGERARLLKRTTAWKQNTWLKPLQAGYRWMERRLGARRLADNLVMVLQKSAGFSRGEPGD